MEIPKSVENWLKSQIKEEDWKAGKQHAENNIMNGMIMILQSYPLLNLANEQLKVFESRGFLEKAKDKVKEIFKTKEEQDAEGYAKKIQDIVDDSKIKADVTA